MTRDEVLTLARQAWAETGEGWTASAWFDDRAQSFARFAELVAAAEREEFVYVTAARNIADGIRARGQK